MAVRRSAENQKPIRSIVKTRRIKIIGVLHASGFVYAIVLAVIQKPRGDVTHTRSVFSKFNECRQIETQRERVMSIKVTLVEPTGMTPFIVEFSNVKQHFTKKAAIELKNKLQAALDDLEVEEAMRDENEPDRECYYCGQESCDCDMF